MLSHRRRPATSSVLNPNLTPLLDVVLQLITFFMMLVHFGTRLEGATRAVRLPVAPAALPGSDLTFDQLGVAMDAGGRLLVRGRALDEEAASKWWADQAKIRRAGLQALGNSQPPGDDLLPTVVILRADAQDKGFAHFSLVVLRRQGQ
jgi:biopolymer transport protein ExbD